MNMKDIDPGLIRTLIHTWIAVGWFIIGACVTYAYHVH